jgi:membrane-associated phospholipid phosphatase
MLIVLLVGLAANCSENRVHTQNIIDCLAAGSTDHVQSLVISYPMKRRFSPAIGIGTTEGHRTTFRQALGGCEQAVYETISRDWQSQPLTYFMRGIQIVSYPPLDILPPVGLYLYDKKDVARTGVAGFVGDCATVLPLKILINRARPVGETKRIDSSFPSGHTTFVFTQAVVYSHYNTRLRIPLYLYAAVVGFSRVYLGKHYPTDVLGGALLGMAVGFLAVKITD